MNLITLKKCLRASVLVAAVLLPFTLSMSSVADDKPVKAVASYQDWKYSGSMWLLTTPDGADLPAEVKLEQFPVLVRMHRDFFDFAQAKPNGDDLRFSSSTGERLAFQIEEWDAANGVASVWVRMPLITGNSRQEIKPHWGNANAASESDGKAVFNESSGYLSVWHMNDPVRDDTGMGPTKSKTVTYLDSANWNPDNLLYGQNGLAAFTFCDVPIDPSDAVR